MKTITSLDNADIKNIVKLHDAKERKAQQKTIFEGLRTIQTALENKLKLEHLYVVQDNFEQAKLITHENYITIVTNRIMAKISTTTTPSGYLAIFKIPVVSAKTKLTPGLVLAQVSNPGNMGTLIRTAAACGIKSIVVVEGTDPWGPKVIQASAGTICQVNIFQWDWQTLLDNKENLKIYGLVVRDGQSINTISSTEALFVIGNEAHGIPQDWQKDCNSLVTLEMPGQTESLNAAIAGSIALYITFVK